MKTEELLRPRFKVIADYPRTEFELDEVIELSDEGYYKNRDNDKLFSAFFEDYPAIFKQLEWWEERKPNEMPKYVKWPGDEGFNYAELTGATTYINRYNCIFKRDGSTGTFLFSIGDLPATAEEYAAYQATLNHPAPTAP